MLLSVALDERVKQIQRTYKKTSQHPLISHCKAFHGLWGNRKLISISPEEIEDWVYLRKSEVKDGTIQAQLSQLRKVYAWAIRKGLIGHNPIDLIEIAFQKSAHRTRRLSHKEEERLEAAFMASKALTKKRRNNLEWSAVRFAILTGCRRMEQLRLKPGNFEIVENERGEEEYLLKIVDGKTGPRTIPLHPEAWEIFRVWMKISDRGDSPWVFWPHQIDKRFDFGLWHYRKVFTPIRKAAGLADFHWHDLRRTFACRLVEQGVSIFDIQKLLGHSSPEMTMIYCCVEASQLRASVLKMWSPNFTFD